MSMMMLVLICVGLFLIMGLFALIAFILQGKDR